MLSTICRRSISNKFKILDLATGKKDVEEWSISPSDLEYKAMKFMLFEGNLLFMDSRLHNDILILNLESRKKFWIQKAQLENQIREKVPKVDEEGEPFDINNFRVWGTRFVSERRHSLPTHPSVNSIQVLYRMELDYGRVSLG